MDLLPSYLHGNYQNLLTKEFREYFTPNAVTVIDSFLTTFFSCKMPVGRYPLLTDSVDGQQRIYANIEVCKGQKRKDPIVLEAHRKYIDIHAARTGNDIIALLPYSPSLSIHTPYDEKKDQILFSGMPTELLTLHKDNICLFFPSMLHMPLLGDMEVTKLVIKIETKYCRVSFLEHTPIVQSAI